MSAPVRIAGMDTTRLARIDEHLTKHYIEPQKIAGCQVAVSRKGQLAHFSSFGLADRERGLPVTDDTIWRIYSMTKPITGAALLSLYERGLFQLTDPLSRYIPAFGSVQVREKDENGAVRLVSPRRPINVRDVMMHMSGFGYEVFAPKEGTPRLSDPNERVFTLEEMCEELSSMPLHFHPGEHWLYSVSTDICARLVEVLSGQRFDDFLRENILDPLGMSDTGFVVSDAHVGRFAANYRRNRAKELVLVDDPHESRYRQQPKLLSGGGGLVSTTGDYLRFARMLLCGGELDGVRILGRKTVELMSSNHLPDGQSLRKFALPGAYGEVGFDGMGFGLTVAVAQSPSATGVVGSPGEFMWGGAASTIFWVDPREDLTVVFMTQFMPSGTFNFRSQLKALVYASIVD